MFWRKIDNSNGRRCGEISDNHKDTRFLYAEHAMSMENFGRGAFSGFGKKLKKSPGY